MARVSRSTLALRLLSPLLVTAAAAYDGSGADPLDPCHAAGTCTGRVSGTVVRNPTQAAISIYYIVLGTSLMLAAILLGSVYVLLGAEGVKSPDLYVQIAAETSAAGGTR